MTRNSEPILVTGANGFVGRVVCAALLAGGIQVRAGVRRKEAFNQVCSGADPIILDPIEQESWRRAANGCSAVVHLIGKTHTLHHRESKDPEQFRAVNVEITRRVLAACKETGVGQFVYVSSIKAAGETASPAHPLTEESPCSPEDAYGVTKREAEALIGAMAETALQTTVLRPPLVYGPGVAGNFLRLMKLVDRGVPLPLRSVTNQRSMVYVGSLASAVVAVLSARRPGPDLFHVADRQPVSTPDLIRMLAEMMGKPARLFPAPTSVLNTAGKVLGKTGEVSRLTGSLCLSTDHIESEIGWKAPYSTEEGLAKTVAWYLDGA